MKISEIESQIAELEAKKKELIQAEYKAAKAKAEAALKELNALGYSYKLVDGTTTPTARSRRTGVRKQVLMEIKKSKDGISRQDLMDKLDAHDTKTQQSVSNAVAALKKAGEIDGENGHYTATGG